MPLPPGHQIINTLTIKEIDRMLTVLAMSNTTPWDARWQMSFIEDLEPLNLSTKEVAMIIGASIVFEIRAKQGEYLHPSQAWYTEAADVVSPCSKNGKSGGRPAPEGGP